MKSPVMYFGALVAGARVLWFDADRAQCLCGCGKPFLTYKRTLYRAHSRGQSIACYDCSAPKRAAAASLGGQATRAKMQGAAA